MEMMQQTVLVNIRTVVSEYGRKMVALSEWRAYIDTNSELGLLSEQWNAGARWLWFMHGMIMMVLRFLMLIKNGGRMLCRSRM